MLFIYYGCCSRRLRTINELLMMMMITESIGTINVLLRGQKKPKSVASPPSNEGGHQSRGPKVPRAPSMSYFTAQCYASAVLAMGLCPSLCVCLCLCPCLSQAGVLLKRQNVGSHK